MSTPRVFDLEKNPLHLGLGATTTVEPTFTGDMSWYEGYVGRHMADDREGRLVAVHRFRDSWDSWEVHPEGSEAVICLQGRITLVQEIDGREVRSELTAGQGAINPPGVWHTADMAPGDEAQALFITAGKGTDHKPR